MTHYTAREYLQAMIERVGRERPIPDTLLTLGGLSDLYEEIDRLEADAVAVHEILATTDRLDRNEDGGTHVIISGGEVLEIGAPAPDDNQSVPF